MSNAWRGVAAEANAERSKAEAPGQKATVRLRASSRALLASLFRPHRREIAILVVLLLAQNAAAMAGPYLVMLGLSAGIGPLNAGNPAPLLLVGLAFAAAAAVGFASKRRFIALAGRVGQAMLLDLRQRVYRHFHRLSVGFHERYTAGRMVARLTSDLDSIAELVESGIKDLVLALLSVVSIAAILLYLDPPLAAVALLSFPALLLLSNWFRVASAKAYRRTREAVALVIVYFVESMGGIRAVQAFGREPRNQEIFAEVNDDYRAANLDAMRLIAVFAPGIKLIGNVTVAVVLTYGGYRALSGDIGAPVLVAFLLYLRRFFDPIQEISLFYNSLQSATAALEKLAGVLQEQPDVAEPATPAVLPANSTAPDTTAPDTTAPDTTALDPSAPEPAAPKARRGSIRFERVSFGYRADRIVLPTFDLGIPAGQTLALVGPTGAGKSTIAKLVARFYDPTTGAVRLDGVDLRDLSDAQLRRAVVMVTQENYLFTGTIAGNIAFGRPEATREEVEAAAMAIGAHAFISALPDGYDTEIRPRGGRLSAGQRQLVAFARAFLADPAVLILDEATSSLDVPTERLVQRALRTILAERTAIIIAHRLSTVEIADRVLVIEDGRIVEDGAPRRLIEGGGRYATLHHQWRDSLA